MMTSARAASTLATIDCGPEIVTVAGSTVVGPRVRPSGTVAVVDLDRDRLRDEGVELDGAKRGS